MELPDHDCPLRPIVLAQQEIIEQQRRVIDETLPRLQAQLEARNRVTRRSWPGPLVPLNWRIQGQCEPQCNADDKKQGPLRQ